MANEWKDTLNNFFGEKKEEPSNRDVSEMSTFIETVAKPAFSEISTEMTRHGRLTTVRSSQTTATLMVLKEKAEEFTYRLQGRTLPTGIMPYAEIRFRERGGLRFITVEEMLRGSGISSIRDITPEIVVQHFVRNYTNRIDHS